MGTGTEEGRAARHGSTAALKTADGPCSPTRGSRGHGNESSSAITEESHYYESYYYESAKGLSGTGRSGKLSEVCAERGSYDVDQQIHGERMIPIDESKMDYDARVNCQMTAPLTAAIEAAIGIKRPLRARFIVVKLGLFD